MERASKKQSSTGIGKRSTIPVNSSGGLNPTFKAVTKEYLKSAVRYKEASTIYHEKARLRSFNRLNLLPINEIDENSIYDVLAPYIENKYTRSYYKSLLSTLKVIFNYAYDKGYVHENPMKYIHIKKMHVVKEKSFWNINQFNKFINTFGNAEYDKKLLFLILFYTGCRKEEAIALRPSDINLKDITITISRAYQFCSHTFSEPKTKRSYRTISLPDLLNKELKAFYKFKQINENSNQLIFSELISESKIRYSLVKHTKMADLQPITVHGLRHSHATMLLSDAKMNDVSYIYAVAKRLGNNAQTLLEYYTHTTYTNDAFNDHINTLIK